MNIPQHITHRRGMHRDVGEPHLSNHVHGHHFLEVLQVELHGIVVVVAHDEAFMPIHPPEHTQPIPTVVPFHGDITQAIPMVLGPHDFIVPLYQALVHLLNGSEWPLSILQDVEMMKSDGQMKTKARPLLILLSLMNFRQDLPPACLKQTLLQNFAVRWPLGL